MRRLDKPRSVEELITLLPQHLSERSRPLNASKTSTTGEFVLYWMHHAVRGHENPALDAALIIADQLSVPVLVYQGLGGNHPYQNDRHHSFIMEGARDAHHELAQRGIRAVFHLPRGAKAPSPLNGLIERASLLITEDYPAPPMSAWTQTLAERAACPVLAVDCTCLVPMRLQPQRFSRAYRFREHNAQEFERRAALEWPEMTITPRWFDGEPGFEPVDLENADILSLCAQAPIDHSVPPVADTRGGSTAGYQRWETFKRHGLPSYAEKRNDAACQWPHGVSRLSPYLHHGHVSPFRIAREATRSRLAGSHKFLDELLIWRELSHNFCFHIRDPESLANLPRWALETLIAHATDERDRLLDHESLERSLSGDELWDRAQDSLRVHGELHNNLRMTWAKAITLWRADPHAVLRSLIDLNHRYALDGSDPNSYGGLLWTLGLFDRPFSESPIFGKLRSRYTSEHLKRINLQRYSRRVSQPGGGAVKRVAIIGAGMAGLAAARTLHDQHHEVTIFEKARGLGGRCATRRIGELGFDHGAQYFTARQEPFKTSVQSWLERGVVAPWEGRFAIAKLTGLVQRGQQEERYVASPGMSSLGRHLGAELDIRKQTRVAPPSRRDGVWRLEDEHGNPLGEFDALICTAPAPQTQTLLAQASSELAQLAGQAKYQPNWTVMIHLKAEADLALEGIHFEDSPLAWAARNNAKPGRNQPDRGSIWVLQATSEWSGEQLESTAETVSQALSREFADSLGLDLDTIETLSSHRWLYALASEPLGRDYLADDNQNLLACGDWCRGARVEDAYLSGIAAAGHLLRRWVAETRMVSQSDAVEESEPTELRRRSA